MPNTSKIILDTRLLNTYNYCVCNTMVPTTNASACKLGYALRASAAQATRQSAAIVEMKLPGEMMMDGDMDKRVAIT